jgi:hypothetical protein
VKLTIPISLSPLKLFTADVISQTKRSSVCKISFFHRINFFLDAFSSISNENYFVAIGYKRRNVIRKTFHFWLVCGGGSCWF